MVRIKEDVFLRLIMMHDFVRMLQLRSSVFYGRDMPECILTAFDSVQDVYFMLKEAM